jgi:hypothetical protein
MQQTRVYSDGLSRIEGVVLLLWLSHSTADLGSAYEASEVKYYCMQERIIHLSYQSEAQNSVGDFCAIKATFLTPVDLSCGESFAKSSEQRPFFGSQNERQYHC